MSRRGAVWRAGSAESSAAEKTQRSHAVAGQIGSAGSNGLMPIVPSSRTRFNAPDAAHNLAVAHGVPGRERAAAYVNVGAARFARRTGRVYGDNRSITQPSPTRR